MKCKEQMHILKRCFPAIFAKGRHIGIARILPMPAQIIACDGDPLRSQVFGKRLIAPDMLRHAVRDLQNPPRLTVRQPENRRQLYAAKPFKSKCFSAHIFSHFPRIFSMSSV